MSTLAPSPSPSPTSLLRQLSCSIPTRLVRPTFLVAAVLLSLHLLLGPSSSSSTPSAAGWQNGQTAAHHRLVWDPNAKEFVHASSSSSAAGARLGSGASSAKGGSGAGGRPFERPAGRPDGSWSSSGTSSSSGGGGTGAGSSSSSSGQLGPGNDVVVFASSALFSLPLLPLVLSSSSDPAPPGQTLFFAPSSPLALASLSLFPSVAGPLPVDQALPLLQRSLAKLDEDQARDEGRWRPDGWERYKELTRLAKERLAKAGGAGAGAEEEEDGGIVRLKGVVLGNCADDLAILGPSLAALLQHAPFSLSCSPSPSSSPSSSSAPTLPWALLAPFARSGRLALLAPDAQTAGVLRAVLGARARKGEGVGWEFVEVRVVVGSGGLQHPADQGQQLPFLADAVVERERAVAAYLAAAAAVRQGAGGKPRPKRRALRNVAVVVDAADGGGPALAAFLKDVRAEIAADPKFWRYALPPTPPSSLAAALLKKPALKAFRPLLPDGSIASLSSSSSSANGGSSDGADADADDDRFTLTLAVVPSWLRAPVSPRPKPFKPSDALFPPSLIPPELALAVRTAGGFTPGPLSAGEKPAKGEREGERAQRALGEEAAFWRTMVEADLVLDLGTGALGEFVPKLLSAQTHTPLLTVLPPPPSSCPLSSPAAAAQDPNTLRVPLALPPSAALRVLRRGAADGVDLGQHWKLREEVVGLLRRGVGWVSTAEGEGERAGGEEGNKWEDVFVKPW